MGSCIQNIKKDFFAIFFIKYISIFKKKKLNLKKSIYKRISDNFIYLIKLHKNQLSSSLIF